MLYGELIISKWAMIHSETLGGFSARSFRSLLVVTVVEHIHAPTHRTGQDSQKIDLINST